MAKKLARVPCGFVLVPPLYLFILSRPISQLFSCRLLLAWGHPSSFLLLLALPQHPSSATPPPRTTPHLLFFSCPFLSSWIFFLVFLFLSWEGLGIRWESMSITMYYEDMLKTSPWRGM